MQVRYAPPLCINICVTETDIFWLAGLLEGEGSFCKGAPSSPNLPVVSCQMTDEDTIGKVASLFGVKYQTNKARRKNWKRTFTARIRGSGARKLMTELMPFMSIRRQKQMSVALSSYDPLAIQRRWKHIEKMTPDMVSSASERIKNGESLRSVARSYGVHHESLRRRLTQCYDGSFASCI